MNPIADVAANESSAGGAGAGIAGAAARPRAWRRLLRDPRRLAGALILALLAGAAIAGPLLAPRVTTTIS